MTGVIFHSMGDLRKHLRSKKYRVDAINVDLVYVGLGGGDDAAA